MSLLWSFPFVSVSWEIVGALPHGSVGEAGLEQGAEGMCLDLAH